MNYNSQPDSTEVEIIPPKPFLGLLIIAAGIIFIFPLSVFGFFLFVFPGIVSLVIGIALIMEGIQRLSVRKKVKCPYCEKPRVVSKRITASKCPFCKKTGVIKDRYMTPID